MTSFDATLTRLATDYYRELVRRRAAVGRALGKVRWTTKVLGSC